MQKKSGLIFWLVWLWLIYVFVLYFHWFEQCYMSWFSCIASMPAVTCCLYIVAGMYRAVRIVRHTYIKWPPTASARLSTQLRSAPLSSSICLCLVFIVWLHACKCRFVLCTWQMFKANRVRQVNQSFEGC